MARLNEILVGRFNKGLQRLFGIKGGPPVATLAPEIMPVHIVRHGNEGSYLENWNRFGWAMDITANAGQTLGIQIRNPLTSGIIAVLEMVGLSSVVAQPILIDYNSTNLDFTTLQPGNRLDGRGPAQQAMSLSTQNTSPASGNFIARFQMAAGGAVELINDESQEIAIPPGFAVGIVSTTVATTVSFWMHWRERFLEESERI
jgi:hypothetical protein